MDVNNLNVKGPLNAGVDQLIESYVVSGSAITSKTFSNLLGNTALSYYFKYRIINGYNGAVYYQIRPNNDSGSNYGNAVIYGGGTSKGASRGTSNSGFRVGDNGALNNVCFGNLRLSSKSGYPRIASHNYPFSVSGTTITEHDVYSSVWNNTADEITSLVFLASQTNGIGIGSSIELWARRGVRN